jgi:lipopolysaccharide transport protein LptA
LANWQKRLRFAIALFVVVFAAAVALSLRKGHRSTPTAMQAPKSDDKAVLVNPSGGEYTGNKAGKANYSIKFGNQTTFADNHSKFGGGVTVVLPEKTGRQITIQSQDAEVTSPPGHEVGTAVFSGGVKLVTSDGITITTATASYNDDDQMTRIPGPLTFTKGRMTGTGVGATYDQQRNTIWLLDQAKVDVVPDEKGSGALHVTSKSAGMARNDHYIKFTGGAHLDGEGHVMDADEATAYLTPDDERVTRLELRTDSRIVAKPGGAGPQDMRAKDIDLAYAADGRTLQSAHLVENASVQLPGDKGQQPKRIAAKAIDVAMGPDGNTATNLTANEKVQVDLPPDGETPARRIRSASLMAMGPPGAGIQAATFAGDVEFRENRAARGKLAAIDRTARSQRMDVKTKPGFGDIEQASFHNNVRFTDGAQTTADSPTAIYSIAEDRLDLSPETGDVGPAPHVSDGRISVDARTIQMTLGAQIMKADTNVRSVMLPQSQSTPPASGSTAAGQSPAKKPQGAATAVPNLPPAKTNASANGNKMPSMLKQDEPVNVKSNRLNYDGAKSIATYEGNSHLWQEDTVVQADTIVIEDNTGNLHATTKVVTVMLLTEDSDKAPKGQQKPAGETTTTTADELLYEDGKHKATYTGNAHMSGPNGDVTAAKIELYLAEQGGQLERAEADGQVVSRQVARRAYGSHLTYLAKEDIYTMTGSPVKIYEDTPPDCKLSEGTTAKFHRTGNSMEVSGTSAVPHKSSSVPCTSIPGTR